MKKQIIAAALMVLLAVHLAPAWANEAGAEGISAVDGNVAISCAVDAPAATPALIFILKAMMDDTGSDVTAERVQGVTSAEKLREMAPEYIAAVKVDENGLITHNCQMKNSLSTGLCHVIVSYIGSGGCYSLGSFEHVGKDDLDRLVQAFNDAEADDYAAVIKKDMEGELDAQPPMEAKNILRKSSAETDYYKGLSNSSAFCEVLYGLKPSGGFSINTLIAAFNESCAWIRLRTEEDTLQILKNYNGKYWNLQLGDDSDFSKISDRERTSLLQMIKAAQYIKSDALEKDFVENVVLSVFRGQETREGLAELISAESAYASYFGGVRKILSEGSYDGYALAAVYNKVLAGRQSCRSFADIEDLFRRSLPENDGGGRGNGGSGGKKVGATGGFSGSGSAVNTPIVQEGATLPFKDVAADSWAHPYIAKLYDNRVVNGISSTAFAPEASVSRQDFVKMLIGILGEKPSQSKSIFTDVLGSYSEPFVMAAYEKGLVSGVGDEIFGAKLNIRREDAAMILSRVLAMYGIQSSSADKAFSDLETASEYARKAIGKLNGAGIFFGDEAGRFHPKAELSRAETCAVLCRLSDRIGGK